MEFTAETVREYRRVTQRKKQRTELQYVMDVIHSAAERDLDFVILMTRHVPIHIIAFLVNNDFITTDIPDDHNGASVRISWEERHA